MVRKTLLFLSIIISLTFRSFAQVSASASTDSSAYLVGDYIHYKIRVTSPQNYQISKPIVKDSTAGLELININKPEVQKEYGKKITTFNYTFSKYDSANVTIPQIPVQYKIQNDTAVNTVLANPVFFTVTTLKINPKEGIKDVKAPIKIPLNWLTIIIWILVVLVVLGAAYYLYLRYRKKKGLVVPERRIVKLPPHVTALNSLRTIEEQKLWQNGKIKEFHSAITEVIRKYFAERFKLPAMELTTSETIELLKRNREAEPILDTTNNFLTNADLVKFAKFSPLTSVNEEMMKQAYGIVKKTIPAESVITENKEREETNV